MRIAEECKPFCIVLLGDRYGWVPPEYKVSATYDAPAAVCLLPFCMTTRWLCTCCSRLRSHKALQWVREFPPGRSITEMEIRQAFLRTAFTPSYGETACALVVRCLAIAHLTACVCVCVAVCVAVCGCVWVCVAVCVAVCGCVGNQGSCISGMRRSWLISRIRMCVRCSSSTTAVRRMKTKSERSKSSYCRCVGNQLQRRGWRGCATVLTPLLACQQDLKDHPYAKTRTYRTVFKGVDTDARARVGNLEVHYSCSKAFMGCMPHHMTVVLLRSCLRRRCSKTCGTRW